MPHELLTGIEDYVGSGFSASHHTERCRLVRYDERLYPGVAAMATVGVNHSVLTLPPPTLNSFSGLVSKDLLTGLTGKCPLSVHPAGRTGSAEALATLYPCYLPARPEQEEPCPTTLKRPRGENPKNGSPSRTALRAAWSLSLRKSPLRAPSLSPSIVRKAEITT